MAKYFETSLSTDDVLSLMDKCISAHNLMVADEVGIAISPGWKLIIGCNNNAVCECLGVMSKGEITPAIYNPAQYHLEQNTQFLFNYNFFV